VSTIVRYSIVRFRPFVETGEFANVGIVALQFSTQRFAFKLAPRRLRRISGFFHDVDAAVYSNTVAGLRLEFKRIEQDRRTSAGMAFDHLTKERESAVTFSEVRLIMADGSLKSIVDELYQRYVMRSFVTPEYREALLTRSVSQTLKKNAIRGYRRIRIEDEIMPISFDLGSESNGTRVIKPLAFLQKSTIGIIDHGATWQARLRHLVAKNKLEPHHVLLPIDHAVDPNEPYAREAKDEAVMGLRGLGVNVIDMDDVQGLISFALPGATPDPKLRRTANIFD
jgi:hypothetical protein